MLTWIREKFGTVVIGLIIGFIAFVFIFYGIFNPRTTSGPGAAYAGTVDGEPITISEFNREVNRRIEFFKNLGGGQLTEAQIKAFRVRDSVFQEMVNRKLMLLEAQRQKLVASDEEVRDQIKKIPAFQKDGKFDLATYGQILQANGHSRGSFERLMREDLSVQRWSEYFKTRVRVSETEIKNQFLAQNDKRTLKYVVLTPEIGKKDVKVEPAEVEKFLAEEAKANLAKSQFESKKDSVYKGKNFDQVKAEIAREILAGEKSEEVQKANQKLAAQVAELMKADAASDARINALLKPYNVAVKSAPAVSRLQTSIPGLGEAKEVVADAFAKEAPIDLTGSGKAKQYNLTPRIIVAAVVASEKPDLSKLDAQREQIIEQLNQRKERELYQDWMAKLAQKAKIERNEELISGS